MGVVPMKRPGVWQATLPFALAVLLACTGMHRSLWLDEGLTWGVVTEATPAATVRAAMTDKPFPPLYFLLVRASFAVVPTELGLRLPSVLAGLWLLWELRQLGRSLAGTRGALTAPLLLLATPGAFYYFMDANPYAMFMLVVVASARRMWLALETGGGRHWVLLFAWGVIGLGTHSLMAFHLGAQLCWGGLLLARRQTGEQDRARRRQVLALAGVATGWGAVLCAWMAWYLAAGGMRNPMAWSNLTQPAALVAWFGLMLGPMSYAGGWTVLLLIPLAALSVCRARGLAAPSAFLLWNWVVPAAGIAAFVSVAQPFVAYRYGLGSFLFFLLLAVLCVSTAAPGMSAAGVVGTRRWGTVLAGVLLIYCGIGLTHGLRVGAAGWQFQDLRGAAACLSRDSRPGDWIWFPGPGYARAFAFYYPGAPARVTWAASARSSAPLPPSLPAGLPVSRVWVVVPTLSNRRPWIERMTNLGLHTGDKSLDALQQALRSPALELSPVASFQRVGVFRAREGAARD
jgi:hypothetical protein